MVVAFRKEGVENNSDGSLGYSEKFGEEFGEDYCGD